ncbi:phosphatidylethanolamine N-methyltransferase isoform X4 [Meleagris gallopavo]|uniref:phosphatidylethanolamine N-methyltransferase isoform X4 n=1 Tax=Meleagris gallopavo TaxID=9103 RepID=UPI000549D926|nr:phosphatidylethanolamine N-methyltransferase isoform X4 [Meleagris gallopavo]
MARVFSYVDVTDSGFIAAVLSIAFNPFFWNVVARWEHKTRALSRGFGSPHTACYCLGIVILLLNCVRSHWCFCWVGAAGWHPGWKPLLQGHIAALPHAPCKGPLLCPVPTSAL